MGSILRDFSQNLEAKFVQKHKYHLVTPVGFEPTIFWMRTRYPKPLDDGA